MEDFRVKNEGSLFLVSPVTIEAAKWLEEHCPQDDDHQYWAGSLVVEHRYISDLVEGIENDGLGVELQ